MNIESTEQNATARLSFSILDGSDLLRSLSVSIIRPLRNISIELLHPSMLPRRKFTILSTDVCEKLGTNDAFLVTVSMSLEPNRHGLLLRIPTCERAYELLETQSKIFERNIGQKPHVHSLDAITSVNTEALAFRTVEFEELEKLEQGNDNDFEVPTLLSSVAETLAAWGAQELISSEAEDIVPVISMKRPKSIQPIQPQLSSKKSLQYNLSPQNEQNPRDFIISRYYNTLYSLTTPLSYFPKTALTRLRNMQKNDKSGLKDALVSVLLTTEQLNQRQQEKLGLQQLVGGAQTSLNLLKFEQENQECFVSRNFDELEKDANFESLVLDLKIREAQLQILVIVELLVSMDVDQSSFVNISSAIKKSSLTKKRKKSLVRSQKKKRLIPTLLGVGFEDADSLTRSTLDETQLSLPILYRLLLSLIDQLGIWGMLQGNFNSKTDDQNYGFLAYVLVPYYNKSIPVIVQFIIKSFKNIEPNFKVPKRSASRQPSFSGTEASPSSELSTKRKSKFSKTHLSSNRLPLLKRTSTTIDSSDLRPPILLKRSKSSLNGKNMHKRQVEILASKSDLSGDQEEVQIKSQSLFLFCDARKVKSVGMSTTSTVEIAQVEATPTKPLTKSIDTSSYFNGNPMESPKEKRADLPQVLATPSNVRVVTLKSNLDFETEDRDASQFSEDGSLRKQTMLEKLTGATVDVSPVVAYSTPFRNNSTDTNVFLDTPENVIIKSSPEKLTSSPVKLATKPGQPITITSSPLFVANLSGSPKKRNTNQKTTKRKKAFNSETASKDHPSSNLQQLNALKFSKSVKPRANIIPEAPIAPLQSKLTMSFDNLEIFENMPDEQKVASAQVDKTLEVPIVQPFDFDITDTDLDSDLEKLMLAPKAPMKKYLRKK